jgi:large subunit ribosomal protein L30
MPGIKVKLVSSRAGRPADQLETLKGLGLNRFNSERILPETPAILGMCRKLKHMIVWERVAQDPVKKPRRTHKPAEQAAR